MSSPRVSVIIPVFNKWSYTIACLRSLTRSSLCSFEVIVVDNASTDQTAEALGKWSQDVSTCGLVNERDAVALDACRNVYGFAPPTALRVIRNETNQGFVGACNQGAAAAKGEFLVFLNNDTEPEFDWLSPLVDLFDSDPKVGVAGSKLMYPDGRLQEAGGIIFNDASGWNYGRLDSPAEPRYNYLREVDYCSGASLMIRKGLFNQLGGFDTRYSPAYCEDSDLCMSARQAGYKVMYQPRSVVIHHEGITAGTDLTSGFKQYQVRNSELFRSKWHDVLMAEHGAPDGSKANVLSHRVSGKRILWCEPLMPVYDRASGGRRVWEYLKILVQAGHHVSFLPIHTGWNEENKRYMHEMQDLGIHTCLYTPEVMSHMAGKGFGVKHIAAALAESWRFDLIVMGFYYTGIELIDIVRQTAPGIPIVVDSHDVHFLREERQAELTGDTKLLKRAQATKILELGVYASADGVTGVTQEDVDVIAANLPDEGKHLFVNPNVHDPIEDTPGFNSRSDLLFVGNFNHTPNIDAVNWLYTEIWPLISTRLPGCKLHVVGNNPPESVQALGDDRFVIHGYVPELDDILRSSRISIAPLRYGAGMKGKVGEALAWGLPVVGTSIASEGMQLRDGEDILVADDPQSFADAVVRLYGDPQLWEKIAANGKNILSSRYGTAALREKLEAMIGFFTAPGYQASSSSPLSSLRPAERPISAPTVSRNAPCPCGSGKKYKFCHGATQ